MVEHPHEPHERKNAASSNRPRGRGLPGLGWCPPICCSAHSCQPRLPRSRTRVYWLVFGALSARALRSSRHGGHPCGRLPTGRRTGGLAPQKVRPRTDPGRRQPRGGITLAPVQSSTRARGPGRILRRSSLRTRRASGAWWPAVPGLVALHVARAGVERGAAPEFDSCRPAVLSGAGTSRES